MFKNKYCIKNNVVEIDVKEKNRILKCLVDLDIFEKKIIPLNKTLSLFKNKNYVYFTFNKKKIRLHRYLTNCPKDLQVDHINRNPLDNRMCNLRCVNGVLNCQNVIHQKNSKSKIRGVDFHTKRNKWRGLVQINHKRYLVGWFDNKEDCAIATANFRKEKLNEYNTKKSVI